MADKPTFDVDLRDGAALGQTLDRYLKMGVCPVRGKSFPGALMEVVVRVHLPDGSRLVSFGRVIQQMGADVFLVQLAGHVDVQALEDMVGSTTIMARPPAAPGGAAAPPAEAPPDTPQPRPSASPTAGPRTGTGRAEEEAGGLSGLESERSNVYAHIAEQPVSEKRRLALHGNKTIRQLLMRDSNKSLHVLVIKNPRTTLDEVLDYSRRPDVSAEALKSMAQNRTWLNSRQMIFNLVRNPSTPVEVAVRLMPRLTQNQIRILAKSANIRMPINAAARKLVLNKLD